MNVLEGSACCEPSLSVLCLRPTPLPPGFWFLSVSIGFSVASRSAQGVIIARPPPLIFFVWSTFEPPEKFRAPCLGPSPLTCVRLLLCPASPSRSCPAPLRPVFLLWGPLLACTPAAGLALGASKMQGFSSGQILVFVSFSCSELVPVSKVTPKNMLVSLSSRPVGL